MLESDSDRAARLLQTLDSDDFDFEALSKADQHWLCHDVLPSYVRHGCYPPPPEGITALSSRRPNKGRAILGAMGFDYRA